MEVVQNGLLGSPFSPKDSQESSPTPQLKSISKENALALEAVKLEARTLRSRARIGSAVTTVGPERPAPHPHPVLEGLLGKQRWAMAHRGGKDADS